MSDGEDVEMCAFCKRGKAIKRNEELTFHQWTSRGYVLCRVTIPIGICNGCEARSWNGEAEAVIEEAIRREFAKLP